MDKGSNLRTSGLCTFVFFVFEPQVHDDGVLYEHLYQEQHQDYWGSDEQLQRTGRHLLAQTDVLDLALGVGRPQHIVVAANAIDVALLQSLHAKHGFRGLFLKLLSSNLSPACNRFMIDPFCYFRHFGVKVLSSVCRGE